MGTRKNKIKIIGAKYDDVNDVAKIKVEDVETSSKKSWVLKGSDFDNFINQIVKESFSYTADQRILLCEKIEGKEFINLVRIDTDVPDKDGFEDVTKLQRMDDLFREYPFIEATWEAEKMEDED